MWGWKKNKYKKKRIYDWCAPKKKNIDAAWGVTEGTSILDNHNIQLTAQDMVQILRDDFSTHDMVQTLRDDFSSAAWRVQFYVSPCPQEIDTVGAKTVFLEEEDHRRERRVASSRMRFRKPSRERERMKIIKEIHKPFWKVIFIKENFNFSPFKKKIKISHF